VREEKIPETSPNFYHSELAPEEVGRMVHENVQKYFENEPEQSAETTPVDEIEPNAFGAETESAVLMPELPTTEDVESTLELFEGAELVLEKPTENEIEASIENGPELYESYELPVKDLELLLVELDANPLETQIEVNQELEKNENG
jgi:hypothetical protein